MIKCKSVINGQCDWCEFLAQPLQVRYITDAEIDFTHLHHLINKENNMNTQHDFTNVCLVAVYHDGSGLCRATAVVSNVKKNTLVDRLDFDPLDFNDDDALDKAGQAINELGQKHNAVFGQLDRAIPIQNCPKCKSKLDAVVFAEDPSDEDTEFLIKLVCWKCSK